MNSGSEFLKAFFIFLIKYLNFRIDFLEEMTIQEFYAILKLLDPFNPMYLNYTNQNPNNPFTNEYFFVSNFFHNLIYNFLLTQY